MNLSPTIFTTLVVLGGLGTVTIGLLTIVIQPMRESLVASTGFSVVDKGYFSAFLSTIAELLKRFIFPVIPFIILGLVGLLLFDLPFSLDIQIGGSMAMLFILICVIKFLAIAVPLLVSVAYLTLFERKVMASMQRRKGPNVVGAYGLLQPLADGLKLFLKESIVPASAHKGIFILSPILTFLLALSL